jgi:clan AA aspartic protease (TIGR02281 family)
MAMLKSPICNCVVLLLVLVSPVMGQQKPEQIFQKARKGDQAALKQLTALASVGNAAAQDYLGDMYKNGEGVLGDFSEAVTWYRKAAEQGFAEGENDLGTMYYYGKGVPRDVVVAYMWFNLAAANNSKNAKKNRAVLEPTMSNDDIAKAQAMGRNVISSKSLEPSTTPTPTRTSTPSQQPPSPHNKTVPMVMEGGVYTIPVLINNAITIHFIVDSGASDVTVPSDVVSTLIRTGTITSTDFTGTQQYTLADGSTVKSNTFRIKSLKVGDIVIENVTASVADSAGVLLLGQSFLSRFKSWSIDNATHSLVLQ